MPPIATGKEGVWCGQGSSWRLLLAYALGEVQFHEGSGISRHEAGKRHGIPPLERKASVSTTVAWIGWGHFRLGVEEAGWRVLPVSLANDEVLDWAAIVERAGQQPDVLLYVDRSLPPPLVGLQHYPCFTVFHCVDSHIHSWYPAWAQAFDACSVSLKDHIPYFEGSRLTASRIRWMPPAVHVPAEYPALPEMEKEYDLLFVGRVHAETTPGRKALLDVLKHRLPALTVTQGRFAALFPKARVVLNIAERGDLNFRVFEGLSLGSCLLTPQVGHGQGQLFTDGEHLFTYQCDASDLQTTAEVIARITEKLLPNAAVRDRVARAGYRQVAAAHSSQTRGKEVVQWLEGLPRDDIVASRLAHARSGKRDMADRQCQAVYLHWAQQLAKTQRGRKYLEEARGVGEFPKD